MSFSFSVILSTVFVHCILAYSGIVPGETTPSQLDIKVGGTGNITCRMNSSFFGGNNSSTLYFIQEDTDHRVPQSDISIINESTIVYSLRNAKEQHRNYVCKSGTKGIAITRVTVATPPENVKDFRCRAFNYKYMICNFTIPTNFFPTEYKLNYTLHSPNYVYLCDLEIHDNQAQCDIPKSNYKYYEFYNFTLKAKNVLGENVQTFWINNFESVILPKPELKLIGRTNESATFSWHMLTSYQSKKFKYEVRLRGIFNWTDYKHYDVRRNSNGYTLALHKLPYAYYNYTISLRIRVNSTNHAEDLWSEAGTLDFQTKACLPDAPPQTDIGSFDLIDAIEPRVRLHWKQRPSYRENGPNFEYKITQVYCDGNNIGMDPIQIDRISAVYSWDKNRNYEFVIKSRNDVGYSEQDSRIVIPALNLINVLDYTPDWIRSIYHAPDRTFTLSWIPPINQTGLVDYTVYWCDSKRALINECNESIQFKHLNKDITKYTTEPQLQEKILNLAVSANYLDFTTGMHWSMCTADTADSSSNLIKMKIQKKTISSREIEIQWDLNHMCTSLLEGYNLTYCRVENTEITKNECITESIETKIVKKNVKSFTITDLKPFTFYRIEIFMFSAENSGNPSDPLILKTEEEAPSPPLHLHYHNVTNNSVLLTWQPPFYANGLISSYIVKYCHKMHCGIKSLIANSFSPLSEISYTLDTLDSYTTYNVSVTAHNSYSSSPSRRIRFRTLLGIPSSPQHLTMLEKNRTIIQWMQPNKTTDRVDFYEISIEYLENDELISEERYATIKSNSCIVRIPSCVKKSQKHLLRVRAVTAAVFPGEVDPQLRSDYIRNNEPKSLHYSEDYKLKCDSELDKSEELIMWKRYQDKSKYVWYTSPWEEGITYSCGATDTSFKKVLVTLGTLVGFVLFLLYFRTLYNKIKSMSNIHAQMPEGLNEAKINDLAPDESGNLYGYGVVENDFYKQSKAIGCKERLQLLTPDTDYLNRSGNIAAIGVSTPPTSVPRGGCFNGSELTDKETPVEVDFAMLPPPIQTDIGYTPMQVSDTNYDISQKQQQQQQLPVTMSNMKIPNDVFSNGNYISDAVTHWGCKPFQISGSGYVKTRAYQMHESPAAFTPSTMSHGLNYMPITPNFSSPDNILPRSATGFNQQRSGYVQPKS